MKKIFLMGFVALLSLNAFAQSDNDLVELTRDVLKSEKKVAVASAINLSTDESDAFWTLYNEYQGKLYEIQNKRIELVKRLFDLDEISNEEADLIWKDYGKYRQSMLNLKKQYYKKFKKILPAGKAVRFFQIENKIEALINAQLAMEVPLMEE